MARKSRRNLVTEDTGKAQGGVPVFSTAVYARLSVENSGKDDDGASLETQINICKEYLKSCPHLRRTEVYTDNGRTGTVFQRPSFDRLMDDIRSGKINCILVRDLSRFGRDYIETGTYLERVFPQLGVRFISVKEDFDSFVTESDSLPIVLQNLINDLYSRDISRKVGTALRVRMERGELGFRKVPYGYRWNEDRSNIVPDEATADYVRSIFRWKLEGISVNHILDRLEQAGAPIPETLQRVNGLEGVNTEHWSRNSVSVILKNPAYQGDMVLGRSRQSLYEGLKETQITDPSQWYVTPDSHEPLVSREDFGAVQRMMKLASDSRAAKMAASEEKRAALEDLFEGKVFCGDCGKRMYFHRKRIDKDKRGRWHAFYECSTAVAKRGNSCTRHYTRKDTLEEKVLEALKLHIQVAFSYEKLIRQLQATTAEKKLRDRLNNQVSSVSIKLRGVSGKCKRLYEDYVEGILDEGEYTFAKAAYEGQLERLQAQFDELVQRRDSYAEAMSPDSKWIRLMKGVCYSGKLDRDLVDTVIEKVLIHEGGKLEIHFKYHDIYKLSKEYIQLLREGRETL